MQRMEVQDMELKRIMNHYLHDYEIGNIILNYNDGIFQIQLFNSRGDEEKLIINDFTHISVTRKEEWGKSKYIAASDIKEDVSSIAAYIQLCSGDEINITVRQNNGK